jgi:OmpA-OmpF porin, OOP family
MSKVKLFTLCMAIAIISLNCGWSQIIDVKGKVKEKATDRANQRTDEGIDKGLNKIEEGVGSLFKKKDKKKSEEKTEETQTTETTEATQAVETPKTPQKIESFTKYDFVAGDQILFFDDFSQDAIGDFPALWTTDGSGEVRTINNFPGNWLYMSSSQNVYCLMKNLVLPDNFIFEFDVIVPPRSEEDQHGGLYLSLFNTDEDYVQTGLVPGTMGFHLSINDERWAVEGYKDQNYIAPTESDLAPIQLNKLEHVIVWVQKRRVRVYHQGKKVIDGPTAVPEGATYNRLRISEYSYDASHSYVSNIKFTSAAPDTRSKLITEGKLVSYGIYFDSGKDVVKPESYGALNDIAKVLKENPTVKIKIVGYTDSDGDDAKNLDLSKRRAANVKNSLVKDFGLDASLIETDGKGETLPLAPNTTTEGKAKNRRVEFIKL